MAAHTYRAGLWEREGFTVWNAQWYGGHHVLGYSLAFSPLAAALGPRLVGVLAGLAAVAVFGRLAPLASTWLFAGGVMSNVVIGRMPFTLGIALGVAAWACAARHRWAAAALSLAATWASPVAGAFLILAAAARVAGGWGGGGRRNRGERSGGGQRSGVERSREEPSRGERSGARWSGGEWRPAAALALPALLGGAVLAGLFPEGGADRFVATAFWPMLAVSLAAAALVDPRRRAVLAGAVLNVAVLVAAFAIPTTFGQNALRLAVVLGPPLLLVAARPGAPRAAVAATIAALAYLAWLPAVRAVREADRDPSTSAAFHREAREILASRVRPGERVEVPLTLSHWEAAHLAPDVALARGWQRQLDIRANPLFYDERPLTAQRYARWLRDRGIGWVALPAAPLDYSAEAERALLDRGVPGLALVHRSRRWRIWRVTTAGAPRLGAARPDGFDLPGTRPGRVVTRERWTRYWTVTRGDACVRRAGPYTAVDVRSPGRVQVRARFSPARAAGRGEACG